MEESFVGINFVSARKVHVCKKTFREILKYQESHHFRFDFLQRLACIKLRNVHHFILSRFC